MPCRARQSGSVGGAKLLMTHAYAGGINWNEFIKFMSSAMDMVNDADELAKDGIHAVGVEQPDNDGQRCAHVLRQR